jgi:hypothetical protein
VYPNPTEGEIEISGTGLRAERLTIEVYDPRGRVVYDQTLGQTYGDFRHKADLSSYAEGVYLIKVSDGERTAYIRVMHK